MKKSFIFSAIVTACFSIQVQASSFTNISGPGKIICDGNSIDISLPASITTDASKEIMTFADVPSEVGDEFTIHIPAPSELQGVSTIALQGNSNFVTDAKIAIAIQFTTLEDPNSSINCRVNKTTTYVYRDLTPQQGGG